jgi:hypothetical protein
VIYSIPLPNQSTDLEDMGTVSMSELMISDSSTQRFGSKATRGRSIQKSFVEHRILNWTSFVEQKLYLDDHVDSRPDGAGKNGICQKGLVHVSPCNRNSNYVPQSLIQIPKVFLRHLFASANDPVYEQNRNNGKPFENLLQLRAKKIQNILDIPLLWNVSSFAVIPYELLLDELELLLNQISTTAAIAQKCQTTYPFTKANYLLEKQFQEWITTHTDWTMESLIGFKQKR